MGINLCAEQRQILKMHREVAQSMDLSQTQEQRMIQESVSEMLSDLDKTYWRKKDENHEFPDEFWDRLAESGWLGINIPEQYGGMHGTMQEEITFAQTVAESGAGFGGVFVYILQTLVALPISRYGNEQQKERYLPGIASGDLQVSFALTEPETGFDTLSMQTTAHLEDDEWVIEGEKTFITGADKADAILMLARTTPKEEAEKRSHGITMFLVDPDSKDVDLDINPLPKMGLNYMDTSHVFVNEARVPADAIVGDIDDAWPAVIELLNPERMVIAAGCVGAGKHVLEMASGYASERVVFERPIGKNQAIQFPLAETRINLEAAEVMNRKAAWKYDNDEGCGFEANAANYIASEWGTKAANHAIQTYGGSAYMKDTEVERFWRELRLQEIAPVSQQMILNYVGEHVLDMPRSY